MYLSPSFEAMTRMMDGEQEVEQQLQPLESPEINQDSLMESRAEAEDYKREVRI